MAADSSKVKNPANGPAVGWDAQTQKAEPLTLRDSFPVPTLEAWRAQAEEELKGGEFDKKLVWRPLEGFAVQPIYRREDSAELAHVGGLPGFAPFVRGTYPLSGVRPCWQVRQDCTQASPEEVNAALRDGLARGQTAVGIRLDNAARQGLDGDDPEASELAGRYGMTMSSINGLRVALADVDLERYPVTIRTGRAGLAVLSMLVALAQERSLSLQALVGSIEHDPVHSMLKAGTSRLPMELQYRVMADMAGWCRRRCPGIRPVMVSGTQFHGGGATLVQELGYTLAVGAEYMREMMARGLSADDAALSMTFCMPVSTNLFPEVAKLRAARMLWARIVKALGATNEDAWKMFLHVRTSAWTKSVCDPYNNIVRAAVEGFAGAVGGCDSMFVAPFDEPIGRADEFSRRVARNQQLLLQEEAHLTKVVDPAAGSYYVEALTDSVGRAAWKVFQGIEAAGGMVKALQAGIPQKAIREVVAKRQKAITSRRMPIVGVSNYANATEKRLQKSPLPREEFLAERRRRQSRLRAMRDNNSVWRMLAEVKNAVMGGGGNLMEIGVRAAAEGMTIGEFTRALRAAAQGEAVTIEPIRVVRAAAPFEALRERAGRFSERTGEAPRVLLVPIGPLAMRRARADFCHGFFPAGGFVTAEPATVPTTADEAAATILADRARVAVICSDDASYPELVGPIVAKVRASRPDVVVIVAGYPEESVAALREAGVDDFVHLRADVVETLGRLQDRLGV
jgi:methylmalonyl-CoA mutase